MSSVFSKIIAGEIPAYKIAEDSNYYAFLDIFPMKKGHTLIVPKKEIDFLFDIDDETLAGMMIFAKKVAKAMKEAIPCQRIGMMVLGMEVPHAHIHLIPIEKESDLLLSNPKLKLEKEEFERIAETIRSKLTDK